MKSSDIDVIVSYLSGIERISDTTEASTQDLLNYIGVAFIELAIDYTVSVLIQERVSN